MKGYKAIMAVMVVLMLSGIAVQISASSIKGTNANLANDIRAVEDQAQSLRYQVGDLHDEQRSIERKAADGTGLAAGDSARLSQIRQEAAGYTSKLNDLKALESDIKSRMSTAKLSGSEAKDFQSRADRIDLEFGMIENMLAETAT